LEDNDACFKVETAFGNEASMMHNHDWSEKLLLATLGLLMMAVVAQIALKYVR
jgi:hypothetical protein